MILLKFHDLLSVNRTHLFYICSSFSTRNDNLFFASYCYRSVKTKQVTARKSEIFSLYLMKYVICRPLRTTGTWKDTAENSSSIWTTTKIIFVFLKRNCFILRIISKTIFLTLKHRHMTTNTLFNKHEFVLYILRC